MTKQSNVLLDLLRWLIVKAQAIPLIFDFQQRVCNNYSALRREFEEFLNVSSCRILDIGCSTGVCAGQVIDIKNNAYTGIDIESQHVKSAARRYPSGTFLALNARDLPFENKSFDVVLFSSVLHHMDDLLIKDCLREVQRVLADTGVVLISEPVFTPGRVLSNFLLSIDQGRYIRTEDGYRHLLDGFLITRQRCFDNSFHRFYSLVLTKRISAEHAPG